MYVADTGNNRVLYFPANSAFEAGVATIVYGQASFNVCTANRGLSSPTASTLNQPVSLARDSAGNLYVADEMNNRVLRFPSGSTTANMVYGQPSFISNQANYPHSILGAGSAHNLYEPYGVALDWANNLYVADYMNNRVLMFPSGFTNASVVYGQPNFTDLDPTTSASGMRNPNAMTLDAQGNLLVADTGNYRILVFAQGNPTAAVRVIGGS